MMSFFQRAKEKAAELGSATKRQTLRGKLEIEARRIEGKITDEKNKIGHAVFPILQDGSLTTNLPEVHTHLDAIAELNTQLAAKRREIEELREDRELTEDEEREVETDTDDPSSPDASHPADAGDSQV